MILKKAAIGILCGALAFSGTAAFAAEVPEQPAIERINLNLDGVVPNTQGVLYDGQAWVPLRAVADGLDIAISWDAETRTANLNDGTRTMDLVEGQNLYCSWSAIPNVLGMTSPTELSGAPVIEKNGRMWVPAEAFGVLVGYDVALEGDVVMINRQADTADTTAEQSNL